MTLSPGSSSSLSPTQRHDVRTGVCFGVRYVGAAKIVTSMRMLQQFQQERSELARACIARAARETGLISLPDRKISKAISKHMEPVINTSHAGEDVTMEISVKAITVRETDSNNVIVQHAVPDVSFSCGGDQDTLDFVAYVAKDAANNRCCYVLECSAGEAETLLGALRDTFNARFQQHSKRTPVIGQSTVDACGTPLSMCGGTPNSSGMPIPRHSTSSGIENPLAASVTSTPCAAPSGDHLQKKPPSPGPLIDMDSEEPASTVPRAANEYYNDAVVSAQNDVVDFGSISFGPATAVGRLNHQLLSSELYYHGDISREQAETLLRASDGHFLVRMSTRDNNQFVLSAVRNGEVHHMLLIDEEGKVRTKDRSFDNIPHLISYHRENRVPITSAEAGLLLQTMVQRPIAPNGLS